MVINSNIKNMSFCNLLIKRFVFLCGSPQKDMSFSIQSIKKLVFLSIINCLVVTNTIGQVTNRQVVYDSTNDVYTVPSVIMDSIKLDLAELDYLRDRNSLLTTSSDKCLEIKTKWELLEKDYLKEIDILNNQIDLYKKKTDQQENLVKISSEQTLDYSQLYKDQLKETKRYRREKNWLLVGIFGILGTSLYIAIQ